MKIEKVLKKIGKEIDDGISSIDASIDAAKDRATTRFNQIKAEVELATELKKAENEPRYKIAQAGNDEINRNLTLDDVFSLLAQSGIEISEEK